MLDVNEKIVDETLNLVPDIYKDGAKPVVKETGKTLSLIPQTINAALVPLRKWIAGREYSLKETEALLARKLEKVKSENIVEPEAYIAVPALQAISYSMNNEVLRNMYANLLANSMNVKTKDSVHPSFVDIIKQMSPNDAKIYKEIYTAPIKPVVDLSISINNESGQNEHLYNITWISTFDYEIVSICISNLIRMGLIDIDSGVSYVNDQNYNIVRNNPKYKEYEQKYRNISNIKICEDKHFINVTALGELFYNICVKD